MPLSLRASKKWKSFNFPVSYKLGGEDPEKLFDKPLNMSDESYQKLKMVEGFRLSSLYETEKEFLQAKVKLDLQKLDGELAKKSELRQKLETKRDNLLSRISKNSNLQVEYPEPKNFDDIKLTFGDRGLSDIAKELLVDKFGTLDNFKKVANEEGHDYLSMLIKTGFNQEQAALINRRLTVFDPIVRKVTPTKKYITKISNAELNQVEKKLSRLAKEEHELSVKSGTVRKHSMFNPDSDTKILTDLTKDRLSAEKFQRKALDAGIDISGIDMPKIYKLRNWLNYTERHSMVEAQTGIPMGQVTMDLLEAEYKKTHLTKASESFEIGKNLKELRKYEVDGKKAWEWFHYVRTDKKTGDIKWDPSELKMGSYTVPEFKGDAPV